MTVLAERSGRLPIARAGTLPAWAVPASATVAVAARLPFLGHSPSPDEGGFLLVGGQWNGAGSSLYGRYWVDRPPLLITIFHLAASLGGVVTLRVIGCVAVALVVLGAAHVAGLLGGRGAARWAAVTAAGLCLSPLMGRYEVSGELLAAPFVLAAMAFAIRAVRTADQHAAVVAATLAGGCSVASMLIKQNLADGMVFGVVILTAALWRGDITRPRCDRLGLAALGGALATVIAVAGWTALHGTSLRGVFDAMYPFRIRAEHVQAAVGHGHATARLTRLAGVAMVSGLASLMVWFARDVILRRRRDASWWALSATMLFATASVLLGGNYWHHYLVELIAPVSVATGVIAARRGFVARTLVAYVLVVSSVGWAVNLATPQGSVGRSVGRAIGASAQPGDTIVTAWGHADLTYASGLSSPYSQLWSLPVKTIDPRLSQLDAVLAGRGAPTWFVTWGHLRSWGLDTAQTSAILAENYRPVETICGRTIYLRDGADRTTPRKVADCHGTTTPLHTMEELLP